MFHRFDEIKLEFEGRTLKLSFPHQESLTVYMHSTESFST